MNNFLPIVSLFALLLSAPATAQWPAKASAKQAIKNHTGKEVGFAEILVAVNRHGDVTASTQLSCTDSKLAVSATIEVRITDEDNNELWRKRFNNWMLRVEGADHLVKPFCDDGQLDEPKRKALEACRRRFPDGCITINVSLSTDGFREQSNNAIDPPGPISVEDKSSIVIILPGIAADISVAEVEKMMRVLQQYDCGDGRPQVELWNWTKLKYIPPLIPVQNRITITRRLSRAAEELAAHLLTWREKQQQAGRSPRVYLVGMSGGVTIAALTCEHLLKKPEGKDFFEKIVFLSGALDLRHPTLLKDAAEASNHNVYNYLSYHDTILTESKFVVFLGWIPIRINAHMKWPAIGRFGLTEQDANYKYIKSQLCWLDRDEEGGVELSNTGGHLNPGCLAVSHRGSSDGYFQRFILPLFHRDTIVDPPDPATGEGWQKDLHATYWQERRKIGTGEWIPMPSADTIGVEHTPD